MNNQSIYLCSILECEKIGSDVYIVTLEAPEGQSFNHQSGQYLLVRMSDNDARPYSIASSSDERRLQLHIKDIPGNDFTGQVLTKLQNEKTIEIQLPMGQCTIDRSNGLRPLLFITGGTGFSHSHAIIKTLVEQDDSRQILLYWGANKESEFYLGEQAKQWMNENDNFTFVPVLNQAAEGWSGESGMVHEAVFNQLPQLADYDIYLSGSSAMVFNIYRQLRDHEVPSDQIFSDMLDILRENNEQ